MRSRTELITNKLEGSDFDDESDFEDSEEDWKPAKGEQKPKKIGTRPKKAAVVGKNGTKKRGRKPAKKAKKESDVSDDELSNSAPTPPKKVKKSAKETSAKKSKDGSASRAIKAEPTSSTASAPKPAPLQRKIATPVKSFPDKGGYLTLYLFKGDLKQGIINNPQVCLWRRDGSSLLQKYLRDKTVEAELPQFNSSMVYSCWEDKRADEYIEIKVKCVEQSKQIRVELTDAAELEAKSATEYEEYVKNYGEPPVRTAKPGSSSNSNKNAAEQDDDDDEEEDEDDDNIDNDDNDDNDDNEDEEEDLENNDTKQEEEEEDGQDAEAVGSTDTDEEE